MEGDGLGMRLCAYAAEHWNGRGTTEKSEKCYKADVLRPNHIVASREIS